MCRICVSCWWAERYVGWYVVSMKMISNNLRGLGAFEKRSEVRRLVPKKKSFFMYSRMKRLW